MQRRSFLKGSALCIGIAATGLPTGVLASQPAMRLLRSPAWARLGQRARTELPATDIAGLDADAHSVIELLSTSRQGFKARLADDIREGRTVTIGGVTLSRSEAALFVFASRTPLA
ncbi:hypothetical protein G3545_04025 [Starkeya sp. ORNL1]|uniref:hypothetical protein n=1 Tax=Starkeya sp. ORNL1 TaxID=2709380 RepID=UPI0014647305|nr:hypothetical protein [Starkeya sp. ORNL1]QJP12901.1 hypothetical protein G3545_04025 [Starkeya sp. ORNL1]